jgi:hypothetical protein
VKFDDRLSTILAVRASGPHDRAVRWRQLVDLVARAGPEAKGPVIDYALSEIREGKLEVAEPLRAAAARAIAGRALLPALLEAFAGDTLEVAAPLLTGARPDAALRAAASPKVRRFLEAMHPTPALSAPAAAPPPAPNELPSISQLLDRLEKLSAQRAAEPVAKVPAASPALSTSRPIVPRRDPVPPAYDPHDAPALFRWECGPGGNIGWVDGVPRGAIVGRSIARSLPDEGVDHEVERAFARRAPFRDATLSLPEAGIVAGSWLISGVPAFAPADGRFVGYRGIARRAEALAPPVMPSKSGPLDPAALRELVHEIKTPLNAIIGFAEIIDGQYLGPAQSGYRARAAEIVAQARILLAGVDDLDFAARLRGRHPGEAVTSDFKEFFALFVERLQEQARSLGVTLAIDAPPTEGLCTLDRELAERLLDRFTAAVLGAAGPGETLRLAVRREDGFCALRLSRPRALEGLSEAEMLRGSDEQAYFALRMTFGLAQIVGGRLGADGSDLVLRMPMAV